MEVMDDVSCYKNISDDYNCLSPKEGECVLRTRRESSNRTLDAKDLAGYSNPFHFEVRFSCLCGKENL